MNIKNPTIKQGQGKNNQTNYNDIHSIKKVTAEEISIKLNGHRLGKDKYQAQCPAHEDKSPSLAITQASDRVLLHCFAGCDYQSLLRVLGVESHQLNYNSKYFIPRKIKTSGVKLTYRDVLDVLDIQLRICLIAIQKRLRFETLTSEEIAEEKLAVKRIKKAWELQL